MDGLEDAKDVEEHLREESRLYPVKHALDALLPFVVVLLLAVVGLELFVPLTEGQHALVVWTQWGVLAYFALEIGVDLWLYTSNRAFLRHKWIDILLLLPFLTLFRGTLAALKALKLVKPAKAAKGAKAAKAAKATKSVKATKGVKAAKSSKIAAFKNAFKRLKVVQHTGKAVKKGKKIVREHR